MDFSWSRARSWSLEAEDVDGTAPCCIRSIRMNKTTRPRDYKTTRRERRQRGRAAACVQGYGMPRRTEDSTRGKKEKFVLARRSNQHARSEPDWRCVRATHLTTQDALSLHT